MPHRNAIQCAGIAGLAVFVGCFPSSTPTLDLGRLEKLSAVSESKSDSAMQIEVIGRDLFWHFRYAGEDHCLKTADDRIVSKDLRIPAGRDVELSVTSQDFVYSFSVPALSIRQIAVPELTYRVPLHASAVGRFEAVVEPACSVLRFHDGPMGFVTVLSNQDFRNWHEALIKRP